MNIRTFLLDALKTQHQVLLVVCLLLSILIIAISSPAKSTEEIEDEDPAILARAELKSGASVTLSVRNLKIKATRKMVGEYGWQMNISGQADKKSFSLEYEFDDVSDYPDEILIVELDPSNGTPEIIFSAFTGGAHCCFQVVIASEVEGKWLAIPYKTLDGGPPRLEDIDLDGYAELITVDQSFNYTFDCYACSWPPLRIEKIETGEFRDITQENAGLKRVRKQLNQMEDAANKDEELWRTNGFLAGWVATKALLGQEKEAWEKMLLYHDRQSDFLEMTCAGLLTEIAECPPDKIEIIPFPQSLETHLIRQKYILKPIDK